MNGSRNIVLVHGGFVDGSGWQAVYDLLKSDGFDVSIVQNPTLSLEGDVAATKQIIDRQANPVVLVGHSYGGAVITEAGNDDRVAALVYIAAFAPDKGESVNTLIADPPPGAPVPPILPPEDGFLFLDRDKFPASFAGDLPAAPGRLHGRLAGPVGRRRARRRSDRGRVAHQAQLVPRRHRRPDDPAARPACDGRACRLHRHRSPRQPLHLPVPARRRRPAHRASRPRLSATGRQGEQPCSPTTEMRAPTPVGAPHLVEADAGCSGVFADRAEPDSGD